MLQLLSRCARLTSHPKVYQCKSNLLSNIDGRRNTRGTVILRMARHPNLHTRWRRKLGLHCSRPAQPPVIYCPANSPDPGGGVETDAKAARVPRRWSTAPCKQPVAMAIDVAHHRLFSGCRSGVMGISDYQAGKIVATVPIGNGVDGAGYDAASGDVFASNADGTLTVIHQNTTDQYHVIENVQTPPGARNMGLDPANHRLFIVSAKFGPAPAGGGRGTVLPGSFTLITIENDPNAR